MFNGQLLTLLINLDRAPDRLSVMSKRLNDLGMTWQRIPAVEGSKVVIDQTNVSPAKYAQCHGKKLNLSEVGCYLSHVNALCSLINHPTATHALILEDDVAFAPDFVQVLNGLLQLQSEWDLVKLSGFHTGTPVARTPIPDTGRDLAVMLSRQTGSAAYLINRETAEKYSRHLLPMYLPYDHMFDKGWETNTRVRLVTPLPTELDWDAPSTIGAVGTLNNKFPWYRRLPTFNYRISTEIRRVTYGLAQWLKLSLNR